MSKLLRSIVLATALALPVSIHAAGLADELSVGPKVGQQIPHSLKASDHDGQYQDFRSLARKRGLIVLFSRSLDWWPYCKIQAVAWNGYIDKFRALGYDVAIITKDSVEILRDYATRENIRFTLLSDPGSEIIGAFGLINPRMPRGTSWYGIALPAIFVIDASGNISHRFTVRNYRDRPDPALILEALRKAAGG